MQRSLIVYYSRTGENYVGGAIRRLETGNTEIAAEMLKELTGAELFEIRPATPYSDDYMKCIEEASGKTIRPLCTNEGSGMGSNESDIRKLCPDANVTKGLALIGGKVKEAKNEIARWIQES